MAYFLFGLSDSVLVFSQFHNGLLPFNEESMLDPVADTLTYMEPSCAWLTRFLS